MLNNLQTLRPLQLKMVTGYVAITSLFLFILILIYQENQRIPLLDKESKKVFQQRKLAGDAVIHILDLTLMGEHVLAWEEKEHVAYQKKIDTIISLLYQLRNGLQDAEQRNCINSILELLPIKEKLLFSILDDQQELHDIYTLLQERIPNIIHTHQKQQENLTQQIQQNYEDGEKESGGFLGMFRTKKRSRYAIEQENQKIQGNVQFQTANQLRSLAKEINRVQIENAEKQLLHMDSLSVQNRQLNKKIYFLIADFNRAFQTIQEQTTNVYHQRQEEAVRTISGLGIIALLLALLFYQLLQRDLKKRHHIRMELARINTCNEELLKSRKNMMLAVSHDLRAPLSVINGYAELIPDERKKAKRAQYSEIIIQSSNRMLRLLNSLLNFHRLDTGKEQSNRTPFRLKSIQECLEASFTLLATKKRLAFLSEYIGGDVVVTGDREKILQIIDNLLSNAIKYTETGEVTLRLRYVDNLLTIEVLDTGTGMTDRQMQQIFQPFERLINAETQDGFGLGLPISLGLAKLLGGNIHVESKIGRGSRFTVEIPLPITDEENPIPKEVTPYNLPNNLRILLIDDDPILLAMTMDMLSCNKISCDGCRNVHGLMELLRERTYDLLITDIKMPEINGYQLLELLRSSNVGVSKSIPVLAATARAEQNVEEFTKVGFAGCLYKPFSQNELLLAIQNCTNQVQGTEVSSLVDFSVLLSGERDNKEMLNLFIHESTKGMEALEESVKTGDLKTLSFIAHHLLPIWEILHQDGSLRTLQHLLRTQPDEIDEEIIQAVRAVLTEGNSIVFQARMKIEQAENE